jgi:hypothetical protein
MHMSRLDGIYGEADRQRVIAAERTRVDRIIKKFLARRTPLELRPASAAIVFLHESIHAHLDGDDAKQTKVGRLILESPEQSRCSVLLASLGALTQAPLEASSWEVNVICRLCFVHDYHWGGLIKAILRSRLIVSDDLARAILVRLSNLADRFDSNFPMNTYQFPFAALVRFVVKAPLASRELVMPAVKTLIEAIRQAVARDLVKLKGYSEVEAETLAATPARWFTKADRGAIELLERWS